MIGIDENYVKSLKWRIENAIREVGLSKDIDECQDRMITRDKKVDILREYQTRFGVFTAPYEFEDLQKLGLKRVKPE